MSHGRADDEEVQWRMACVWRARAYLCLYRVLHALGVTLPACTGHNTVPMTTTLTGQSHLSQTLQFCLVSFG